MTMTPAQKQRAYRERLKERRKTAPDQADEVVRSSFATFLDDGDEHEQELTFIDDTLDSFGMHLGVPLTTDEDAGWRDEWEASGRTNRGALSRAERMVGGFLDIARTLAELINRFKLAEIAAAEAALANADLSTPEAKRAAMTEAARLDAMRRRLLKETRRTFPAITVKGD